MIKQIVCIILFFSLNLSIQSQNNKPFLETIANSSSSQNTAKLAGYLVKTRTKLNEVNKAFTPLSSAVRSNKRSSKKKYAISLKNKTELLIYNSNLARKYAQKIINNLKSKNENSYISRLNYIDDKLYSLNYAAKELLRKCNSMADRPSKYGGSSFNRMLSASKTMTENLNKILKNVDFLLDLALSERYN